MLTEELLEEWFGAIPEAEDPLPHFNKWSAVHPSFVYDLETVIGRARTLRKELKGIVYFVASDTRVKIGKTLGVTERMKAIQPMSPVPLRIARRWSSPAVHTPSCLPSTLHSSVKSDMTSSTDSQSQKWPRTSPRAPN